MKTKLRLLIAGAVLVPNLVLLAPPAQAQDCTEDVGECIDEASCKIAGAVNRIGRHAGVGDLIYCLS